MARTLLLVDDNDLFRGMLSSMLALRGYTVVVARKGPEGLAIAAAQPIDAALTDVDMPEMDGFEFCRQLCDQQRQAGREIPVWIMTGMFRPALAKKAAAAGAMLVLRKPFPIEEVCQQLEQELQKRESQAAAAPETGESASDSPPAG